MVKCVWDLLFVMLLVVTVCKFERRAVFMANSKKEGFSTRVRTDLI
jgi:hypothetical protein